MNKMQALVLALAMSVTGGALAAGGESAPPEKVGFGVPADPKAAAAVKGVPALNPGTVGFVAGVAGTLAATAGINSTSAHQ